jgi:cytochrome c
MDAGHRLEIVRDRPHGLHPGTKMPEQRIGSAEDRAALVGFLEKATKKK